MNQELIDIQSDVEPIGKEAPSFSKGGRFFPGARGLHERLTAAINYVGQPEPAISLKVSQTNCRIADLKTNPADRNQTNP